MFVNASGRKHDMGVIIALIAAAVCVGGVDGCIHDHTMPLYDLLAQLVEHLLTLLLFEFMGECYFKLSSQL